MILGSDQLFIYYAIVQKIVNGKDSRVTDILLGKKKYLRMLIVIELPEVYEVGTLNMLSIQHPVHDQFSDERI